MLRSFSIALIIFFSVNQSYGQFYKSILPSPEFTKALEKVVLDYRHNFKNIKAETAVSFGEVETFESTVKLPDAIECNITQYHSVFDTSASWQAVMYRGEDYKEAAKMYRNSFRLIKKSSIKWIDRSTVSFTGEMTEPTDGMRFTVSALHINLEDNRYKRFEIEVELINNLGDWEVRVNIQSKKKDTEGGPGAY